MLSQTAFVRGDIQYRQGGDAGTGAGGGAWKYVVLLLFAVVFCVFIIPGGCFHQAA